MDEIDRMDMPGFLSIRAWALKKEKTPPKLKHRYIDQVWPEKSAVRVTVK